jgi:hypothetical protein
MGARGISKEVIRWGRISRPAAGLKGLGKLGEIG